LPTSINPRPKVLLLIPHLGGGGAEQVTALLARNLSSAKYEVHLGLVTQSGVDSNPMPPSVCLHPLGAARVRFGIWPLLRLVWRLKPEVILSGMAHLNLLVLLLRPLFPRGTRVLVRQNGALASAQAFGDIRGYTRLLYRLLYRRADCVVCQTPAMALELARELRIPETRLAVLPNPVDVEAIRAEARAAPGHPAHWSGLDPRSGPHLLAVGRLSREKGFDLLLSALAIVRERFPTADLIIAGTGAEEAPLKAQCRQLGLESAVFFAGHVQRPAEYFRAASVFVLSSRHEGMPNAMLEAAAAGLPIVALPSSQGVVDLLGHEPGVWLAGEISSPALRNTLLAALASLQPYERFSHTFIQEFALDQAIQAYESILDTALAGSKLSQSATAD
jgi:glycosyltransferase involved in cell wall biosynthesis